MLDLEEIFGDSLATANQINRLTPKLQPGVVNFLQTKKLPAHQDRQIFLNIFFDVWEKGCTEHDPEALWVLSPEFDLTNFYFIEKHTDTVTKMLF